MRPLHPLAPLLSRAGPDRAQKKKRRVRATLARARRQRIDPTQYGSVHIAGVLLDTPAIVVPSSPRPSKMVQETLPTSGQASADKKLKKKTQNDEAVATPEAAKSKEIEKTFAAERARNLALLSGIFGDEDVLEGREDSVREEAGANESAEIALGPTRQRQGTMSTDFPMPVNDVETTPPRSPPVSSNDQPGESISILEQQTEAERLKDLFAPAGEPGMWI